MTKRARQRLFYSLIFIFIAFGTSAAFYAQGWRLDFETLAFNKVGAIYIKPIPSESRVFLDGKQVKKEFSLFQSGSFINNLTPDDYLLTLDLQGYRRWERKVTVRPALVSEF